MKVFDEELIRMIDQEVFVIHDVLEYDDRMLVDWNRNDMVGKIVVENLRNQWIYVRSKRKYGIEIWVRLKSFIHFEILVLVES